MEPVEERRWVGVGRSADADASRAGVESVQDALAGRDDGRLVLLFASDAYDLQALVNAAVAQAGAVPLVGCSTAGELSADGPAERSAVAVALGGPGFTVSTAFVDEIDGRLRDAGAEAGACVGDVAGRPHRILVLLTDALAGDQQAIVRGAYSVAGAGVPLVGGGAAAATLDGVVTQFHGSDLLTNGVVAAAIGSDAPLGIGVRHGWRQVGEPLLVTAAEGHEILALDEQPALDAYLGRLGQSPESVAGQEAFGRFAITHPLGALRRAGEEQIRLVVGADFERRTLLTRSPIAPGGLVWLMEGDAASVLAATDGACEEALAGLGSQKPLGLVVFDCMVRRSVLDAAGLDDEIARIAAHAQGAPVGGFYSHGEIARTRGLAGYHNQTFVVLAVA